MYVMVCMHHIAIDQDHILHKHMPWPRGWSMGIPTDVFLLTPKNYTYYTFSLSIIY